jgi:eukaryotic-like serine/threonine-protein kinase
LTGASDHDGEDSSVNSDGAARQQRLEEALAIFLNSDISGAGTSRQQLIADYPDLADELAAFFADHDRMRQLAPLPWRVGQDGFATGRDMPCSLRTEALGAVPAGERAREPTGVQPWLEPPSVLPCRFGDYELREEIGRGGMGVVYKARQSSLNRIVAVKMIRTGLTAEGSAIQRFRAEAEAAAKLQHPHIVQVYEVGQHEGQPFFSMQYVEGRNLSQLLRESPLSPKRAARYLHQISQAVAHAHEHGVLHRDLKPSNVLIDLDDQPQVLDFGLAKQLESDADITVSGQLLGTPPYMSPEQAGARRGEIGPASDVYSLGAVLYELLTGQPPFGGATPLETLQQVRDCDPRLPRTLNPQVPRDLEMICLKCLEKDPRHRYPDAKAFAEDLERYLHGDSISISSLSLFERLARALERGALDVEFRTWRRILRHFAWIVLLAHVILFLAELRGPQYPWSFFAAVRATEYTAMGIVLWLLRRDWYPPRGGPARQLFALWAAYVAGSAVLHLISPFEGSRLYPQYAVLASIGFFMMGSSYWGYCNLIGVTFLVLAVVMTWIPSFVAPLAFGIVWAASLLALARRLRQLSEER